MVISIFDRLCPVLKSRRKRHERYTDNSYYFLVTGKMFPSRGDLHVAPFTDEALYMEQINKVNFWYQEYFHGVNLGCLRDAAMKEYFRQPIVSIEWTINNI